MNEETLNMSVRKFLKKVGVTSQREIEEAVRNAGGGGPYDVKVTLEVPALGVAHSIEGKIETE